MQIRPAAIVCLLLVAGRGIARAQWTPSDSHTTIELRGLSVAHDSTIWVGGQQGTVLVSTDLGQHWRLTKVTDAATYDFRGTGGIDAKTASAMISSQDTARIYRTTDGGATWTRTYNDTRKGAFLDAMAFWDAHRGLVVGDPMAGHVVLLTTTDGGVHWTPVSPSKLPAALPGEGTYAASNTSIITHPGGKAWVITGGTTRSRVYRTADYGATWQVADLPLVAGNDRSGAFAVAFRDDLDGIVVGGDYRDSLETRANVAITSDGGVTWTPGDSAHVTPFLSGVAYARTNGRFVVVAVGLRGTYVSTDEGMSWVAVDRTPYNGVAAIGPSRLVAIGPRGRVAYATVAQIALRSSSSM